MKNYGIGVLKDGVIVKVQPRSEARYILDGVDRDRL